jgi:hypothetical protein
MTPTLQQALQVAPLVLGPIASAGLQAIKNSPVPLNAGQVATLRLVLALTSIACGVGLAWLGGSLATFDLNGAATAAWDAILMYASASAAYEHVGSGEKPAQP